MDTLPQRVLEEPIKDGPAKGLALPRTVLEQMVKEYYRLRGWNTRTGVPTSKTLKRLGLKDIVPQLRRYLKPPEKQVLIVKGYRGG
jgi:aldehyde:ferredoxin oxidoreductase